MERARLLFKELSTQVRQSWKYLAFYHYLPASLVLLAAFALIYLKPSIDPEDLFRDITALTDTMPYLGFVSQLGALLWMATTTSCLLAWFVLYKFNLGTLASRQFLLTAGLFTGYLTLDDMFLIHEGILPPLLESFSIGQGIIYVFYILFGILFVYMNRKEIFSSEYFPFFLALGWFALSVFWDVLEDSFLEAALSKGSFLEVYEVALEDSMKFLGIVTWLAYYLRYINSIFSSVFQKDKGIKK